MSSQRWSDCWLPIFVSLASILAFTTESSADDRLAYFEQNIRPLLVTRCYSCHSSSAGKSEGGLLLDTRAGWAEGGDSGSAVIPGDIEASLLIQAIRYTDPNLQMPPDRAVPQEAIAKFERWVQMGAPDPREATADDNVRPFSPSDPVAGRDHWAYRELTQPLPPLAKSPSWAEGSIDSFVHARRVDAKLGPADGADARILVRRIYVHLTGLPPTPEQVAAFISDTRPDALERLVDALLASPHFGERWGRHWLDLARYADSNGLDENFLFREAWRYRNQVIDAMNGDVPYDQFLREQIAGDLLPYDSIEQRDRQRVASGFLVVGPKVLLDVNTDLQRMDVADEQIDTIGKAVLGQTIGCARCHDHKFDPIPTSDYYALAGILTSTQIMEKRHMLNQQRRMEQLVGLGQNGKQLDDDYEKYWRQRSVFQAQKKNAERAINLLRAGDFHELASLANEDHDVVADIAIDSCIELAERLAAQQKLVDRFTKLVTQPPAIPPRAMIPSDMESPADEFIRLAGQYDRLGEQVPRGVLRVLSDGSFAIAAQTSGRLDLAEWLTNVDGGAGHLAARVLANRIWYQMIGRGIVRTVDNFGRTGEEPSHPELLDYLANRLIESGWSVKSLVREISLSRTFSMSSAHDEANHAIDPDNRWLWRAHRRRLDPETLRDAMLLAADSLDLRPMESTVSYLGDQATAVGANKNRRRTDFPCRSIYLPVIRNDLPELFDVFDFADPQATTGMRPQTLVATQGLFLLNDASVLDASQAIARRLLDQYEPGSKADQNRIDKMFELIVNALSTDEERSEMLAFINDFKSSGSNENDEDSSLQAWAMACQAMIASSRFQVLE